MIRCRIPPHENVAMHHHPVGSVIIFMTDQNLRQTLADGTKQEAHHKAGEVLWAEPVTHMGENYTDQPYKYLRVDITEAEVRQADLEVQQGIKLLRHRQGHTCLTNPRAPGQEGLRLTAGHGAVCPGLRTSGLTGLRGACPVRARTTSSAPFVCKSISDSTE